MNPPDRALEQLYATRDYPEMSHPTADPAVTSAAALLGGLACQDPSRARILEIGCASGHHLIPLAIRWPESEFHGIDLSERAIAKARERAAAAGLRNISFHAADLRRFAAGGPFHHIIAHGFFSWVPDEVKHALLAFCRERLAPDGIAAISFNLAAGWAPRLPVIETARRICAALGCSEIPALRMLRDTLPPARTDLLHIIDDMLAKGPDILPFDDFAPVNDPWPLDRFLAAAAHHGLTWLGEADPAENLPADLDGTARERLGALSADPLALQMAADLFVGRTFRTGVLRRSDAPVPPGLTTENILSLAIRTGHPPRDTASPAGRLFKAVEAKSPACLPARAFQEEAGSPPRSAFAQLVLDGIVQGMIRPRIEPVHYDPEPPDRPQLDAFRLLCARQRLLLVDAWHVPLRFPPAHYEILALMDGSRSRTQIEATARERCPDLAFGPWLAHLASRGIFQHPPATSRE